MIAQNRSRELKALNTQLRRQEYLAKKQLRVSESVTRALETAESNAKESVLRVMELEKQIIAQKKQTRRQLLKTYRDDVQSLKQQKRDLQKSVAALSIRYRTMYIILSCPNTDAMNNPYTFSRTYRRDKQKKSCQQLDLFKLASISKKKIVSKNKDLRAKIKVKFQGKANLSRRLKEAEANANYWENQNSELKEELEGNPHTPHKPTPHAPHRPPRITIIPIQHRAQPPGPMDGRHDQSGRSPTKSLSPRAHHDCSDLDG